MRPISASQDVLFKMCQKWAPFCSMKLCLATNRNRNSTFLNGTKKIFFSNMINCFMFGSMFTNGDFLFDYYWGSSTVGNVSPCRLCFKDGDYNYGITTTCSTNMTNPACYMGTTSKWKVQFASLCWKTQGYSLILPSCMPHCSSCLR